MAEALKKRNILPSFIYFRQQLLVVATFVIIYAVLIVPSYTDSCEVNMFRCNITEKCIASKLRCNGDRDCGNTDYSDENNCSSCTGNAFYCNTTKICIPILFRCNGRSGCGSGDSFDEENCDFCNLNAYHCNKTKRCIAEKFRCDGFFDCGEGDKSDEENCEFCQPNMFLCNVTKRCIANKFWCNGQNDCGNGDTSDEESCSEKNCQTDRFYCNVTKRCISNRLRCNGRYGCGEGDKSDEENCDFCISYAYHCNKTRRCIPESWRCNGRNDCGNGDKSDEENCETCLPNSFFCNITKSCIPDEFKCNGIFNCGNGDTSDEENCDYCISNAYHCNTTKQCIPESWRCSGRFGCRDKSDEENCGICLNNSFHCNISKNCIPTRYKCDGDFDCGDGDTSDEDNCESCLENWFHCKISKRCIKSQFRCDGDLDCGNGDTSDEENCVLCSDDKFFCNTSKKCIKSQFRCDGDHDCRNGDSSDEENCVSCSGNAFYCNTSKRCIKSQFRCDGDLDCGNGDISDEENCVSCLGNAFYCNISSNCITSRYICDGDFDCGDGDTTDEENCGFSNLQFTNMKNSTILIQTGKTLELICNVTGRPNTAVQWSWESLSLKRWPADLKYELLQDDQILVFRSFPEEAQGKFMCIVENENGTISAYADVITNTVITPDFIIGPVVGTLLGLTFVVSLVLLIRFKWKQRKLYKLLNDISKNIYVDLSLEQSSFEISRRNLKLEMPLGTGAFGLVLKAQAFGVDDVQESSTVAVKTVKANASENDYIALLNELKMMVNLGSHSNIVRLLGACTQNLSRKKELLVVMEFCKYGNLKAYMRATRKSFTNQLDLTTDKIDPSITLSHQVTCNPNTVESQDETSQGKSLSCVNIENAVLYTEFIQSVDLLNWAWQIAQGMEYISSKNILHGDLAARNVLLTEDKIAKICDFGLAREMSGDSDYEKNVKGALLPIKWMAIESISCGVFSSKSDCWSYGVFLWELFTLGKTPYTGMEVKDQFCQHLKEGRRLEKPEYAPTSVYVTMRDCWAIEPSERPTFTELSERFRSLINEVEKIRLLYLDEAYTCLIDDNCIDEAREGMLNGREEDVISNKSDSKEHD